MVNDGKKLPIPSQEVPSGPVKGHKLFGDDIDLTTLLVPFLHRHEGGNLM